jgi:hypothetical protein
MKIKKKTVKDLLESYASEKAKFTPIQFLTLLRVLTTKKDGTTSEYVQKLLAPLYMELSANRLPHPALVLVILEKLNKPFFRRKKNQESGEEEEEMAKTPGTIVKRSNFINTKAPVNKEAELRKKLDAQWRQKLADSYKAGERDQHIKSVGNGL